MQQSVHIRVARSRTNSWSPLRLFEVRHAPRHREQSHVAATGAEDAQHVVHGRVGRKMRQLADAELCNRHVVSRVDQHQLLC